MACGVRAASAWKEWYPYPFAEISHAEKGETQTDCFVSNNSRRRRSSAPQNSVRSVSCGGTFSKRERTRVFYSSMIWVKNKAPCCRLMLERSDWIGTAAPRQFAVYWKKDKCHSIVRLAEAEETCLECGLLSFRRSDNRIIKRWVSKGHMWRTGSFVTEIEMFGGGFLV